MALGRAVQEQLPALGGVAEGGVDAEGDAAVVEGVGEVVEGDRQAHAAGLDVGLLERPVVEEAGALPGLGLGPELGHLDGGEEAIGDLHRLAVALDVLHVDADVAVAGDNFAASEDATHNALADYVGSRGHDLSGVSGDDIRYALMALAGGATLEELRFKISPALFAILQANAASVESGRSRAMSSLTTHFDIDESEFVEEQHGPAVFGASLVNFPKTLKTRTVSPKYAPRYNPVSSHSLR